ncbi:hypothetical protein NM449_17470 (plasmid) [Vibrio metschnikovii]|uniref:hypothetical protein n=1 Tax=Vibrio metschnikovii TaxID=28172 RepID=UPI00315DD145
MIRQDADIKLSEVVLSSVELYLFESNLKTEPFLKQHLLPVLVDAGLLDEPSEASDYNKWVNAQSKRLTRYLIRDNDLRADWVMPMLSAIPGSYRRKAMHQLCGFFGTHFVPISPINMDVSKKSIKASLCTLSKDFSEVLQKSSPAMDGVYSTEDDPQELLQYANEIFELATSCFVELGKIYQATGTLPSAHQTMALSPLFNQ